MCSWLKNNRNRKTKNLQKQQNLKAKTDALLHWEGADNAHALSAALSWLHSPDELTKVGHEIRWNVTAKSFCRNTGGTKNNIQCFTRSSVLLQLLWRVEWHYEWPVCLWIKTSYLANQSPGDGTCHSGTGVSPAIRTSSIFISLPS